MSEVPTYFVNGSVVSCVTDENSVSIRQLCELLDQDIRDVSNWGYYANCCFWLLYIRSFELVLFFRFIIFMELGNNVVDVFMKLSSFMLVSNLRLCHIAGEDISVKISTTLFFGFKEMINLWITLFQSCKYITVEGSSLHRVFNSLCFWCLHLE